MAARSTGRHGNSRNASSTSSSVIPASSSSSSLSHPTAAAVAVGTTREVIIKKLRSRYIRRKQKKGGTPSSGSRRQPSKKRNRKAQEHAEGREEEEDPSSLSIEDVVHRSVLEMREASGGGASSHKASEQSTKHSEVSQEKGAQDDGHVEISIQEVFRGQTDSETPTHFNSMLEHLIYRVNSSMTDASGSSELLIGMIEQSKSPEEKLAVVRCIDAVVTRSERNRKGTTLFFRRVDNSIQKLVNLCIKALPDKYNEKATVDMKEVVANMLKRWSEEQFQQISNVSLALVYLYNQGIIKRPVRTQSAEDADMKSQQKAVRKLLVGLKEKSPLIGRFNKLSSEILNLIQALLGPRYYGILMKAFPSLGESEDEAKQSPVPRENEQKEGQGKSSSAFAIDPRYAVSNCSESDSFPGETDSGDDAASSEKVDHTEHEHENLTREDDWSSSDEEGRQNEVGDDIDIYRVFVDESGQFDYDEYQRWESEARNQLDAQESEEAEEEPDNYFEDSWETLERILPLEASENIQDSWKECKYNLNLLKGTVLRIQRIREQFDSIITALKATDSSQEQISWRLQQARNMREELTNIYRKGMDIITAAELVGIKALSSECGKRDDDYKARHNEDNNRRKRKRAPEKLNNSGVLKDALGIGVAILCVI
eukprot:gb/GECG01000251.1/.p1 GENE.gb/GECG01000251.1/~~gb/GECG01000251.1/.p1  ORF type:complete len:655 (+),score=116.86 gb/GECG01000251.1/:1-1965(+)